MYYTVNTACNAAGDYMKHYMLFKSKGTFDSRWKCGPPGTVYNTSPSGWMEKQQFLEWFEEVFIKSTRHLKGPVILFLDGHLSHISLDVINKAIQFNIHIICLPPHSSHAWQPLDVAVYGPAKKAWQQILREFFLKCGFENVSKNQFGSLFGLLCDVAFTRDHAKAGFRKTGLYPLDRQAMFDQGKIKASFIFTLPVPIDLLPVEPVNSLVSYELSDSEEEVNKSSANSCSESDADSDVNEEEREFSYQPSNNDFFNFSKNSTPISIVKSNNPFLDLTNKSFSTPFDLMRKSQRSQKLNFSTSKKSGGEENIINMANALGETVLNLVINFLNLKSCKFINNLD